MKAQLERRLAAVKPGGRVQRTVPLSADEKRNINTDQKRTQRARTKLLAGFYEELMAGLRSYALPFSDGARVGEFAEDGKQLSEEELEQIDDDCAIIEDYSVINDNVDWSHAALLLNWV